MKRNKKKQVHHWGPLNGPAQLIISFFPMIWGQFFKDSRVSTARSFALSIKAIYTKFTKTRCIFMQANAIPQGLAIYCVFMSPALEELRVVQT